MKIYHQFRLDLFPNRDSSVYVKWLEDRIDDRDQEILRLKVAAGETTPTVAS